MPRVFQVRSTLTPSVLVGIRATSRLSGPPASSIIWRQSRSLRSASEQGTLMPLVTQLSPSRRAVQLDRVRLPPRPGSANAETTIWPSLAMVSSNAEESSR
nr:hypothetical protein GCM10020241_63980 [Streptoalloteichus tenebrarius]